MRTLIPVSAGREELRRLIQELPEEEVPAVLGAARSRLCTGKNRASPPAWFGAAQGQTSDAAARSEDLLEGGFGGQGVAGSNPAVPTQRKSPLITAKAEVSGHFTSVRCIFSCP